MGSGIGSDTTTLSAGVCSGLTTGSGICFWFAAPEMRSFKPRMAWSSSGGASGWLLMVRIKCCVALTILSVLEMTGSGRL